MTTVPPCIVGSSAPEFTLPAALPDLGQQRLQSADYRGRWLAILFYPRDFSFVCPTELTGFSAEKSRFDERGCDLLGISIDSVESHLKWLQTPSSAGGVEGLQFPLASDPHGELCKRFGVWREQDGLPNRGLFLIDPSGQLRYAASYDLSVGRNVEDVLRSLDALQAGGVCPANWKRADGVLDVASLLQPGRVLGHYRIERELGRGAFGQVLQADDLRLERKVALKVISKQDGQTETKLLREARSAASINHPNVCTVYSADTIDTLPTIVMEYLEGRPLVEVIGHGFDQRRFRRMAHKIALGLSAAHAQGVVHGDLKPANILLRENNEPVLVDFGLAQSLRQNGVESAAEVTPSKDAGESPLDPSKTLEFAAATATTSRPGGISGTPAYMSPEQASGERLNESSDIFSLGLIFAQMLTGKSPMSDLSVIEIITSLRRKDFVESLVEKIPSTYRADLVDMLAMKPEERPSAGDVCQRMAQ
ncbi:protein kinase domain-containing protein [Blastopirellula marina]|nr:redoxin domain-containing protein [Blastopirellula marina]